MMRSLSPQRAQKKTQKSHRFVIFVSSFVLFVVNWYLVAPAQKTDEHLRKGEELAGQGRWKEAEEHLRAYLAADPKSPRAAVLHARALLQLNQPFDAALELEALLETSPDDVPALKLYAALLDAVIQDDAKAEAILVRAAKLAPRDLEIWQALGHHFVAVRKAEEAIRCFIEALKLSPSNASLLAGLASAYSFAGERVKADSTFARALRLAVRSKRPDAKVYLTFAEHLQRTNRMAECVPVFTRALLLNPHLSDAYFGRALAYEKLKDYLRAEADALASLRESDGRRDAHQLLFRVYRARGDQAKSAEHAAKLEALTAEEQSGQSLGRSVRALLREAEPLLRAGKFGEAAGRYEEIVKLSPSFYEAWFALGMAYSQTARAAEAETAFRKYLSFQPLSADGYAALGVLLAAQQRGAEARPLLERALALDAAQTEAGKALARLFAAAQEWVAAGRAMDQALTAEPGAEPESYFLLMTCQLRTHDRRGALATFARALQAHRNSPALLKGAAELLLREDPREMAAETVLSHLRKSLPDDPEARYLYAHWLFILNNHGMCLDELNQAVSLPGNNDKTRMEIYALMGMAEHGQGHAERAEAAYLKSLEANRRLARHSPLAAFKYVELLVKSARDDEAQKLIDEILVWSREFAPAHLERARSLIRRGQTEKGVESGQLALKHASGDPEQVRAAHALLAKALFSLGRTKEAEEHQRQVEALSRH
jgi:tetratricopeptide (TPR) repeat protein